MLASLLLIGVMGLLALPPTRNHGPDPAPAMPPDLRQTARDLATAFGQGDLYRSPDKYPLTDSLKTALAKLPSHGQDWPAFVGLSGEVVVVLQGRDGSGQAFTDVVAHVLNQGVNRSTQLTQIDLRLVQVSGHWQADRLLTLPKGTVQP